MTDLQAGVVSDLKANVTVVNQLAQQIASINDQISKTRGSGHTPNDLLDKRDQLIKEMGQYVQTSTVPATANGRVASTSSTAARPERSRVTT